MDDSNVKVNSAKAWLLAARPKTLTGAAVPVAIGIAAAINVFGDAIRVAPAVLCMLFALIMQVDANFVNDYFDFMKGTDDELRLGPKRACEQGWITAPAMRKGILTTTVIACLVGFPLMFYGSWELILVGLACVVFCFLYTITLSYMGLGDVLVLVFFGIVPVCLTFSLVSPSFSLFPFPTRIFMLSVACGLVIDTLLVVNNYRDIDNDLRTGKNTLIVKIGARGGRLLYLWLGIVAAFITTYFAWNYSHTAAWHVLIYIPAHCTAYMEMVKINKGRKLNKVLGMTALNILIYGILVSAGLILGR